VEDGDDECDGRGRDRAQVRGSGHASRRSISTPRICGCCGRGTLRRREGGCDEGWHLKLPAGGDSRDKLRLPLSSGGRRPPSRLVTLVRARPRGAAVGPAAELTPPAPLAALRRGGRDVAELVEDRVVARAMGDGARTESWREIEVEHADYGDTDLLDRIESWLLELGARR
jgi:hypothetical protein